MVRTAMLRKIPGLLCVGAMCAAGGISCNNKAQNPTTPLKQTDTVYIQQTNPTTPEYRTIILTKRKVSVKNKYVGTVKPRKHAILSPSVAGTLLSINVREGEYVRKGEVLARVDASTLITQKQIIEQQLAFAKDQLARRKHLYENSAISEVEFLSAKNQVEVLTRQLEQINTQIEKAYLRAPFDGVIDEILAEEGQWVAPGIPVIRLVGNEGWEIVVPLPERLKSSINPNSTVHVETGDGRQLKARVRYISRWIDPANRVFKVYLDVLDGEGLFANQIVDVWITEAEQEGFLIPSEAVHADREQFIWVEENGEFSKLTIKPVRVVEDSLLVKDIPADTLRVILGTPPLPTTFPAS